MGYTQEYSDNAVLRQDLMAFVREVVDEGSILLKNDNALPLAGNEKVTLLGQGSVNWLSSGTGSSEISDSEFSDLTLKKSLEDAGFSVNGDVWNFYSGTGKRISRGGGGENADWSLNETDWAAIEAQCGASLGEYNDAAVLVVSRIGCEGGDLPRNMSWYGGAADENYLELSATERGLLEGARKAGFKKIIVLLNCCNALQMDFIDDPALGVNACLAVGATGANGLEEVGKILSGAVNPSGHMGDIGLEGPAGAPVVVPHGFDGLGGSFGDGKIRAVVAVAVRDLEHTVLGHIDGPASEAPGFIGNGPLKLQAIVGVPIDYDKARHFYGGGFVGGDFVHDLASIEPLGQLYCGQVFHVNPPLWLEGPRRPDG